MTVHADLGVGQRIGDQRDERKAFQCQRTRGRGSGADVAPVLQIMLARRQLERHRLRPQCPRLGHALAAIGAAGRAPSSDGALVPQVAAISDARRARATDNRHDSARQAVLERRSRSRGSAWLSSCRGHFALNPRPLLRPPSARAIASASMIDPLEWNVVVLELLASRRHMLAWRLASGFRLRVFGRRSNRQRRRRACKCDRLRRRHARRARRIGCVDHLAAASELDHLVGAPDPSGGPRCEHCRLAAVAQLERPPSVRRRTGTYPCPK